MAKASDIKKGSAVTVKGKKLLVKEIDVQSPGARGAATLYRMRFTDLETGTKVEDRFKGDEVLTEIDLSKRPVNFSYIDGEEYIFMDSEDYSQFNFNKETIKEELLYITEEIEGLQVMIIDGQAVALEIPQSVEMVIEETSPSIKGASASARTKPATFITGLVVQVPEYLSAGERVKINTSDKRFMGRAN